MRGKMWFLGGVAVGFVVGARAGREKYDQLVASTRRMMDHPTVQEAAGVVQEQANRLYSEGKETVSKRLGNSRLGERMGRHDTGADAMGTGTDDESLAGSAKPTPGSTV